MLAQCEISAKAASDAPMRVFDDFLKARGAVCIVAGIALGQQAPRG